MTELRQKVLACLNAGRIAVEAMIAFAEVHPDAMQSAWRGCRVLIDLADWFNCSYPASKPITGDDDDALLRLIELRTEMLTGHTLWDLER